MDSCIRLQRIQWLFPWTVPFFNMRTNDRILIAQEREITYQSSSLTIPHFAVIVYATAETTRIQMKNSIENPFPPSCALAYSSEENSFFVAKISKSKPQPSDSLNISKIYFMRTCIDYYLNTTSDSTGTDISH